MSESKVALITGANKGIGFETARQLGQQGMTVLIGARDAAKGEQAAKTLQAEGICAEAVVLDVTSRASVDAAAETVGNKYGHLDILVNNAGVFLDWGTSAFAVTEDVLRQTYETNVLGPFRMIQAFLPLLKKSPAGRIVNLSSVLGSTGLAADPSTVYSKSRGAAYATSKAALNMLTVAFANELRRTNIKVNNAHPGWVKTEMGGAGAQMEIPEGAQTSVRLATLPADGPTAGFFHKDDTLPW
ncbi:short-chain dehydrogenase [Bryobacterales bacterium F-183]|nr:short-chain dehydrogenase [Bryobacterales bacterium F-183]